MNIVLAVGKTKRQMRPEMIRGSGLPLPRDPWVYRTAGKERSREDRSAESEDKRPSRERSGRVGEKNPQLEPKEWRAE